MSRGCKGKPDTQSKKRLSVWGMTLNKRKGLENPVSFEEYLNTSEKNQISIGKFYPFH